MIKISIISKNFIFLDKSFNSRGEAIEFAAQKLYDAERITDIQKVVAGVWEREKEFSTYMEGGIAIPHCKVEQVKATTIVIIRNDWELAWADQQERVDLIFLLVVVAQKANKVHLKILAELAQAIMDQEWIKGIKTATDPEMVLKQLEKFNNYKIN